MQTMLVHTKVFDSQHYKEMTTYIENELLLI